MSKKLFVLALLGALSISTSYSSEKKSAALGCKSIAQCDRACRTVAARADISKSACMAACMTNNGLSDGVSAGSQSSSSSYPTGSDHASSSVSSSQGQDIYKARNQYGEWRYFKTWNEYVNFTCPSGYDGGE